MAGRNRVGVPPHLSELIEEQVRAARAGMECSHQRLARPAARGAPGSVQHHIVDAGAQRVVRRPEHLRRDAGVACLALKCAQVLHDPFAQHSWVRGAAHCAQAGEQLQQWRRGDRQWRDTDRRCRGWIDRGQRRRGRRCGGVWRRRAAASARDRANDSPIVVRFRERVIAHWRFLCRHRLAVCTGSSRNAP